MSVAAALAILTSCGQASPRHMSFDRSIWLRGIDRTGNVDTARAQMAPAVLKLLHPGMTRAQITSLLGPIDHEYSARDADQALGLTVPDGGSAIGYVLADGAPKDTETLLYLRIVLDKKRRLVKAVEDDEG